MRKIIKKRRRPGGGRKPLPAEERRRQRVVLNLTDQEHAQLMKAAQGESPAAFARSIVLRYLTRRRS